MLELDEINLCQQKVRKLVLGPVEIWGREKYLAENNGTFLTSGKTLKKIADNLYSREGIQFLFDEKTKRLNLNIHTPRNLMLYDSEYRRNGPPYKKVARISVVKANRLKKYLERFFEKEY